MKRPNVFVYENSIVNRGWLDKMQGTNFSRNLYHIPYSQGTFIPALVNGMLRRKTHPNYADLFFAVVPILAPPFVSGTEASMTSAIEQQCLRDADDDYTSHIFKFMNVSNRHLHFLLPTYPSPCIKSGRYSLRLNRDAINVEHSGFFGLQMPYLSNMQSARAMSTHQTVRPTFMSYTGSLLGQSLDSTTSKHYATNIRMRIHSLCKLIRGNVTCKGLVQEHGEMLRETAFIKRVLRLKQRSLFCLEPPGMGDFRKSAIDSILSGCIPVFFMKKERFQFYMPFHFAPWSHDASVLIDPQLFLQDPNILVKSLSDVDVRQKQRVIRKNAHKLLYSKNPTRVSDATDTFVEYLYAMITAKPNTLLYETCKRMTDIQSWRCNNGKG